MQVPTQTSNILIQKVPNYLHAFLYLNMYLQDALLIKTLMFLYNTSFVKYHLKGGSQITTNYVFPAVH